MNIVVKDLSDLKHPDSNARIHPVKQISELKRSLEKNGQTRLLVIDENGTIWIGNGLFQAMQELGYEKAHCILKEGMTENEKKKMMLSDNRIFDLGVDDMDAFDAVIKDLGDDLDIPGYDLELLTLFVDDMDALDSADEIHIPDEPETKQNANKETKQSDDEPEFEPPATPKSKRGQIYQLGNHRLMCGDSTNAGDVIRLANGAKVQLLLTDPPYNVNYEGTAGSIENDNMDEDSFSMFLYKAFKAADYVMKPGASFYIWHADSNGLIFRKSCENVGWNVRQCLVWVKNSLVLGRQDYQWKHEPCLYGWKDGSHLWTGDRKQTTVLEYDKPKHNDVHPTMKPVRLFEQQMCNSTNPGDIVLDLFGGSGTTLIAAEQNNRIAFCMEYDPKFVDVIIDRWELMTGCKAILLSDVNG